MFRRITAFLLSILLILSTALAETASPSELDESFAKIFNRYKAVGACVVVAKDGEIVYENYHGYAYKSKQEPVTENTYFRIASVTKMVSAIRVMQLVEQGHLDLDADLSDYFGFTLRSPRYKKTPITLRMLMSHTSSILAKGQYEKEGAKMSDMLNMDNGRTAYFAEFEPGSKYEYSNYGAGLMGSLIETVTGENFDLSVRHAVLEPLGSQGSYFVTNLPNPELAACIYGTDGKMKVGRTSLIESGADNTVNPDLHYHQTASRLWLTGRDLCRIGMLLCNGGTLDGVTLLQPETVEAMMADQKGQGGVTGKSIYGLCVNRVDTLVDGKLIYGHQGLSNGILANVYFDPETNFVFALLSNGCDTRMDNRIGIMARQAFKLSWNTFSGGPVIE